MLLEVTAVVVLIGFLLTFINYGRVNYLFRKTYGYGEDLDKLTKALLDKAEGSDCELSLTEYTIYVNEKGTGKVIGQIWIANYPYSYGHYYDRYLSDFERQCVSYETFKRSRALHLKLIEIKKNLALNKQQEYINNKIKEISGE